MVKERCQHHNGLKLTEKTDSHAGGWLMVPRDPRELPACRRRTGQLRRNAPPTSRPREPGMGGEGEHRNIWLGSSRPLLASQKLIRIGSTKCQDIGMMIQDAAVIINPQIHSLSSSAHGIHSVPDEHKTISATNYSLAIFKGCGSPHPPRSCWWLL